VTVTISGSGYTGNLQATVLWDGTAMDTFTLSDGAFNRSFIIPPGAAPGSHTITVCSGNPCFTGEFAETASANYTVIVPATPTGTPRPVVLADYQIMAVEVTQGVRGDIPLVEPTYATPGFRTYRTMDTAVHVAHRRTIIRVYPDVELLPGSVSRPVEVDLSRLTGEGTVSAPIHPLTRFLIPSPGQALETLRSNGALSWNFVLPDEWVQEGEQNFLITLNRYGLQPECSGCSPNNNVYLDSVDFAQYHTQTVDVRIYIADLAYYDAAGDVVRFVPSAPEISSAVNYWLKVWPVDPSLFRFSYRYSQISQNPAGYRLDSMGNNIWEVDPPIPGYPQWNNQVYKDENPDLLEPRALLRPPYSFIPLIFDPDSWMGCAGNAGIGYTPLFHAGACGPTVAQEATHSIGINHAGNSHGEDSGGGHNPDYPGIHGQVEANAYGFDVWAIRALPPTEGGGHRHDFMSYGGGDYWVSIYTWQGIADLFGGEAVEVGDRDLGGFQLASLEWSFPGVAVRQSDQEYLRISGTLLNDRDLYLDTIFIVDAPARTSVPESSPFTLLLEDRDGNSLYEQPLPLVVVTEEGVQSFYELVPIVESLARIVFLRDGQEIAVKLASPNPPTVTLLGVSAGDEWAGEGELTVSWEGHDPDGDALTYRLQASPDGKTWVTLVVDTPRTEEPVNLAYIPGWGENWSVRVVASDGVHVASDVVEGVSIAAKPPIPMILQPPEGGFLTAGWTLEALGQAFDYVDGDVPGENLVWLLDGVEAGRGSSILIESPSEGEHTLTLEATNSEGLTGSMEVTFVVGEDTDGDGMPDSWEGEHGLLPKEARDAVLDLDGDGLSNAAEFVHGLDPNDPTDGSLPGLHSDSPSYPHGGDALGIESTQPEEQVTQQVGEETSQGATEATGPRPGSGLGTALMVVGGLLLLGGLGAYLVMRRRRPSG
jgi:hypothetical protein